MKIRIELDGEQTEDEIVIRCQSLTDEIRQIQKAITSVTSSKQNIILYKDETEYYIALEEILFFETEGSVLNAHTRENIYQARYRLYELEGMFAGNFVRVSKSTIVNMQEIYSLARNTLSSASVISFAGSHKQVFVSRHYYRQLKEKLSDWRKNA